jgi:hypothetical protein
MNELNEYQSVLDENINMLDKLSIRLSPSASASRVMDVFDKASGINAMNVDDDSNKKIKEYKSNHNLANIAAFEDALPQKTIFDESLPSMENMKSSLSFLELAV